ncbi:hypothetical protein VTK56DRAFT_8534 [Thermocarpiscus australiensis]
MRPDFSFVSTAVGLLALGSAQATEPSPDHSVRQVAIIGAGAAGSSAAYHLHEYTRRTGLHVNITLFEKTGRIGGRTLTINAYGDPTQPVELGASIFIQKNHILYGALNEFNLSKRTPDEDAEPILGIWDGDEFLFKVNQQRPSWWTTLQVLLKYGVMAPWRTQKLMETTIGNFLRLYEEPFFHFRSLTQRTYELGLVEMTGVTGEQLLKTNKIDDNYAHDIVQASTRVNYASNLARIHGLDTMVSMATRGAMSVQGGNWQIFQKMVERSGAVVALNTSVVTLEICKTCETPGGPRYSIRTKSAMATADSEYPIAFDNIIIANPYQFSNITAGEGVIHQRIDEIPYVQLHVTIFASPYRFSPQFFGLTVSKDVPGSVLTTLGKADDPTSGAQGEGKAGFFSTTILRKAVNPITQRKEYIYKIFSPEKVTPEFLSRLLGVEVPDTFVGQAEGSESASPISWYHPHVFFSYPKALPRVTFQDPIIGPGLYYTSGMESFISTMETNALMGKNVARLLIDDILAASSTEDSHSAMAGLAGDHNQRILGQLGKGVDASPTPMGNL